MNRLAVAVAAVCAAAFLPGASRADVTPPKDIAALYARSARALETKYLAAVERMCAPGFKVVDVKGSTYDLAAARKMWVAVMSRLTNIRVRYAFVSAAVNAKTATVVTTTRLTAQAKNYKTGKMDTFLSVQKGRDVLVKTAGGWVFKSMVGLAEKTTMNGKEMTGM